MKNEVVEMVCKYSRKMQDICNRNRLVEITMLSVFREGAAIDELEPLLKEYDHLADEGGGCLLLLAELINNLGKAYKAVGREQEYGSLCERLQQEAPGFSELGWIKH